MNFLFRIILIAAFILSNVFKIYPQEKDSTQTKTHSPKKATILSAVVPGAGQFYNKKYWKIPVIYTGFGALSYSIITNQRLYKDYRSALRYRTDDDINTTDNFPQYSVDGLMQAKNYYRRNLELSYIFSTVLYVLNIVDAAVDAHFYEFDISDDISLKLQPALITMPYAECYYGNGFSLTLKIKN